MLPKISHTTCRKNVFAFIVLLVLILITYSNTFDASWHFDDESNILENIPIHLTALDLKNIKKTFHARRMPGDEGLYRPVACLSFALNYYFGQTNVFGYHLVNVMVHILAAFFLYLFIQSTLNLAAIRGRYGPDSYVIALLATILWAINPIQTQAVTYIVQRMASMAGMFYITAMYFYLKGRTSDQRSSRTAAYILCFVSGALAVGSKENASMLPFTILLFELFLIQEISRKNVMRFLYFLLITVGICLLVLLILEGPSIFNLPSLSTTITGRGFSLGERLLTEPRVILFYISLLLYPMPNRLCLEHDISISTGLLTPPSTLVAILVILAIILAAAAGAKKRPLISFCIIFFFLNHIIEGTFIPLELIFEHRNYIPSMLFFVPISIIFVKALALFPKRRSMRLVISVFIVLVIIVFGRNTFIRNAVWKNDGTLWLDALEKNPNTPRPYHNLGSYYFKIGLKEAALDQYKKSLSLPERPNIKTHHSTLNNIGAYYKAQNKNDLAQIYFLEASRLQPGLPQPYLGLAILSFNEGLNDTALNYLDKALHCNKDLLSALKYKGFVLLKQNKLVGAIDVFKRALEIDPDDLQVITHLGIAYKQRHEFGSALSCFKKVLSINKRYIPATLHLIELYILEGQKNEAERAAKKLIDLFPDDKFAMLIDKIIFKYNTQSNTLDLAVVYEVLERTVLKKADRYRNQALKLKSQLKKMTLRKRGKANVQYVQ